MVDDITIQGNGKTITFDPPSDSSSAFTPLFLVRHNGVTFNNLKMVSDGRLRNDAFILLDNSGTFTTNNFAATGCLFKNATRGILSLGGMPVNFTATGNTFENLIRAGLDLVRDLQRVAPANRIYGTNSSVNLPAVTGFFVDAGTYSIKNNTFRGTSQTNINIDAGNDGFEPLNMRIIGSTQLLDVPGFARNTPTDRSAFNNVVVYFRGGLQIHDNNGLVATEFPIAVAKTANVSILRNSVTTVDGNAPAFFASGINVEHDAANVTVSNNTINVQADELNTQGISIQAFNDHGRVLNINASTQNVTLSNNIITGRGTNAIFVQGGINTRIDNNDLDGAFGLAAFVNTRGASASNISIFGFAASQVPNPANGGQTNISQSQGNATFVVGVANPGGRFNNPTAITTTGLRNAAELFPANILRDGSPQQSGTVSPFQFY